MKIYYTLDGEKIRYSSYDLSREEIDMMNFSV
jgi:hypothetical protein